MPRPVPYDDLVAALREQDPAAVPGADVVAQLALAVAAAPVPGRTALKIAVRALAQRVADRVPGRTVELRVPPFAAVQCVAGPRHTRGTPPNVVEVDSAAFVALCTGRLGWAAAERDGRLRASGERAAALQEVLPLL